MAINTLIINYGMGNLRSVQKACQAVGADAVISESPDDVAKADRLILPGVGAFGDGMQHLAERRLIEPIHAFAQTGLPFLGICLGMQLILGSSTEDAPSAEDPIPGLGLLPGSVVRFEEDQGPDRPRLKVPHMGWNRIDPVGDPPLFRELPGEPYVYFVHGYYAQPERESDVLAWCDYGRPFAAAVGRDHLWATQFHPEKSQRIGLQILKNFLSL